MDPETIAVCFRYTQEDYVQAFRLGIVGTMKPRSLVAGVIVTFLLGVVVLVLEDGSEPVGGWLGRVSITVSLLIALIAAAVWFILPRWIYRRETKLQQEYRFEFSPSGIRFESVDVVSSLRWSTFRGLCSDADVHLLLFGRYGFTAVPRSAFANAGDDDAFVRMARAQFCVRTPPDAS